MCVEGDAVAALVGKLDGWVAGVLGAHCARGHKACTAHGACAGWMRSACGSACGTACGCSALVDSEFEFEEASGVAGEVPIGTQCFVVTRHV